jgi:hypothetical protein
MGKVYNILLNHIETISICEQLLGEIKRKMEEKKEDRLWVNKYCNILE